MKPSFDIVVIGASAGGIEAGSTVVRALPSDLPAAVMVAMHFHFAKLAAVPRTRDVDAAFVASRQAIL